MEREKKKNDSKTKIQKQEDIRQIFEDFWEWYLKENPIHATLIGDERYDDKLPDISRSHKDELKSKLKEFKAKIKKFRRIPEQEKVNKEVLIWYLDDSLEYLEQDIEDFQIDHISGNHLMIFEIANFQKIDTKERFENFIERIRKFPKLMDDYIENLRIGIERKRTQFRIPVQRCIKQCENILSKNDEELPLWRIAKMAPAEETEYRSRILKSTINESLKPAINKFLEFLKIYNPREKEGISSIPQGEENYLFLIKHHTTLKLSPEEIHRTGLEELREIQEQVKKLAPKINPEAKTIKELMDSVRRDKKNFFSSKDEIVKTYEKTVEQIYGKLEHFFGKLPKSKVIVKPVEEYLEKDAVGAFYYRPSANGDRPGIFYINTYMPEQRPKYEIIALAVHEAVPGHHLQIALAQELDLPQFRRYIDWDAFTEGWGLYAERVADEMDLYQEPIYKLGMFTMQAWRAIRLVVDTGLHHFGWSREKAIEFFSENAGLEDIEVINEVDRYIIWPAQALAYMIGMKKILELRALAQKKLKDKFSLKLFHDTILSEGGIPLEILDKTFKRKMKSIISIK